MGDDMKKKNKINKITSLITFILSVMFQELENEEREAIRKKS